MNHLTEQATKTEGGRFAYLAPQYRQVKQSSWDALKQAATAPGVTFNESELRADFPNGARIQLFGAENYQALRGMHLDGAVVDEYGDIDPDAWTEVLRPALAIKRGFAIFIGTPKGRNHFFRMHQAAKADPEWFTALYRHEDSGVIADEEIARARKDMTPEHFAQEYECSFEAAIKGAYYAQQLADAYATGRVRHVPWEPTVQVETWWDLGWSDSTAIIFTQQLGRELHVIDYVEAYGQPLAHYAQILERKPYLYLRHNLPHDAGQHELGSGKSLDQQLRLLVTTPTRVLAPNAPLDGINQARLLFPRCWFDGDKCERLLDALAAYKAEWQAKAGDYKPKPDHNWASHGADAFRYLAVGLRAPETMTRKPAVRTAFDVLGYERGPRVKQDLPPWAGLRVLR